MSATIGCCGVCCDHCGMRSRIPEMAEELRRFVQAYRYGEWIQHVPQDFEFGNFIKGLNWFAGSGCKGCLQGGGMPACEVRTCCKEKGLKNCYFCGDFARCKKLGYQKATYKINESYDRIRQTGYENWLKEQNEKADKGFDNIRFLSEKNGKNQKYSKEQLQDRLIACWGQVLSQDIIMKFRSTDMCSSHSCQSDSYERH